jgi:hypothetical protein
MTTKFLSRTPTIGPRFPSRMAGPKLKIWLRDPLPMRAAIKGINYEIRHDIVAGGPGTMNLEAERLDTGRAIKLQELPAPWEREEYDAHAWFESLPGTPARRLANALLTEDLAVLQPEPSWVYRYDRLVTWAEIEQGCRFHDGRGWKTKTNQIEPEPKLFRYLIRLTVSESLF